MTAKEKENLISQFIILLNKIPVEQDIAPATPKKPDKLELLTVKQCTQAVEGLSEHTVRQLVAQKKISAIRSGIGKRGKILVYKDSLFEYLKK